MKNGFNYGFTWRKVWSKTLEITCLVPLMIKGKNNFPEGPYVVIANHASYLDIILLYGVVPHRFRFLGKAEILKWPIINSVFKQMDIPVERGHRTKAFKSLEKCGDAIDEGHCIIIFPEGGWDPNVKGLQRFKNGAFKLAIEKQVPIVPISFMTNKSLFCDHTDLFFNGRPGLSKTLIHPPIETKGKTASDLVSLRQQAFETINSVLPDDY
ncbi:MAG: 1-acyl-sn-glycerol-3-phosphate acyltransferase [Flavobacteriales bacterium]|nr:1-acyl-sn-glycerol-3-phosphate acyltransferase [Flavobacteriales bacterium]